MSFYVHVSYLQNGGMSFGFEHRNEAGEIDKKEHVRMTASQHSQTIPAYYDVRVKDGVAPSLAVIHEIVDEAFAKVPQPPWQEILTIHCKNGSVEMLVRDEYPQTADRVKEALRPCLQMAIEKGTVLP